MTYQLEGSLWDHVPSVPTKLMSCRGYQRDIKELLAGKVAYYTQFPAWAVQEHTVSLGFKVDYCALQAVLLVSYFFPVWNLMW